MEREQQRGVRNRIGLGGVLCVLGVVFAGAYLWNSERWIARGLDATAADESEWRYLDELAELQGARSGQNIPPPGLDVSLGALTSPDGCLTVYTKGALYNHHSYLRVESTGAIVPLVSIQEPDPWSGSAHGYRWSSDSNAVFFLGRGSVVGEGGAPLPLVYVVSSDKFLPGL